MEFAFYVRRCFTICNFYYYYHLQTIDLKTIMYKFFKSLLVISVIEPCAGKICRSGEEIVLKCFPGAPPCNAFLGLFFRPYPSGDA